MRRTPNSVQKQIPLALPVDEALVLKEARELFARSRFLSAKYASFDKLMADPLAGQCMRLAARQRLRLASRARGR